MGIHNTLKQINPGEIREWCKENITPAAKSAGKAAVGLAILAAASALSYQKGHDRGSMDGYRNGYSQGVEDVCRALESASPKTGSCLGDTVEHLRRAMETHNERIRLESQPWYRAAEDAWSQAKTRLDADAAAFARYRKQHRGR